MTSATVTALPANTFAPGVSYATGALSFAIATADFNHDGITDIVTANSNSTISVLLGVGDGSFTSHVDYPVPSPLGVTVADFNNDGNPDLAVRGQYSYYPWVLTGNPDGTFQPAIHFPYGTRTGTLVASDFNGDGNVDLLDCGDQGAKLHPGDGDGTFQSPVTIYSGQTIGCMVADLRRNGRIDMIPSRDRLLLGNSDGSFQSAAFSPALHGNPVAVGDLNGDQKPDLVSISGNLYVSLGNGDGTFQADQQDATNTGGATNNLLLADVNGDGKTDVLVSPDFQSIKVSLGNGDGTLRLTDPILTGSGPRCMTAGDFNGDGQTDLALTTDYPPTVTILLGAFTPTLTVASTHSDPFTMGQSGATYAITVRNASGAPTSGAVTVTDTLPPGLTATAIDGPGWSCTPATLTCTRSDSLAAGNSYPDITVTVTVAVTNPGSVTNRASVSGGGSADAAATDVTTILWPPVTIQTVPSGLQFSVDGGVAYFGPKAFHLPAGSHTLAVSVAQTLSPGVRYAFTSWSDGGDAVHTITAGAAAASYTANFKLQYLLTATAIPSVAGSFNPVSGSWHDAGAGTSLTATANPPYIFDSWTGDAATTANPLSLMIDSPKVLAANFSVPGFSCEINGDGATNVVDVQLMINEALGVLIAVHDLTHDGRVDVTDIQKIINAALGVGCVY